MEQSVVVERGLRSPVALAGLEKVVAGQAAVQSYADTSRVVALVKLFLAPLVLLLDKPRFGVAVPE
jgi:hypothetical protein